MYGQAWWSGVGSPTFGPNSKTRHPPEEIWVSKGIRKAYLGIFWGPLLNKSYLAVFGSLGHCWGFFGALDGLFWVPESEGWSWDGGQYSSHILCFLHELFRMMLQRHFWSAQFPHSLQGTKEDAGFWLVVVGSWWWRHFKSSNWKWKSWLGGWVGSCLLPYAQSWKVSQRRFLTPLRGVLDTTIGGSCN